MKKSVRQQVFDRYGGKCAYCGCELVKGWHVDHLEPVVRAHEWCDKDRRWKTKGMHRPENDNIDNYMPSCASCNINKHSETLEQFRKNILGYFKHLNEVNTQYKMVKRYGLITEHIPEQVTFYFETLTKSPATGNM